MCLPPPSPCKKGELTAKPEERLGGNLLWANNLSRRSGTVVVLRILVA